MFSGLLGVGAPKAGAMRTGMHINTTADYSLGLAAHLWEQFDGDDSNEVLEHLLAPGHP